MPSGIYFCLVFFFVGFFLFLLHWIFPMAYEIVVPRPGIEFTFPRLESGFFTTGLPGKSPLVAFGISKFQALV